MARREGTRVNNVLVVVNGNTLFHSIKGINREVDYGNLLDLLVPEEDKLFRAMFYSAVLMDHGSEMHPKQRKFLNWLGRTEYQVVEIPWSKADKDKDRSYKNQMELMIASDIMNLIDSYDTLVLVSGSGNLEYPLRKIRERGRRIEIVGFKDHTSDKLIEISDEFINLSEHEDDFLKEHSDREMAQVGDVE